jgi:MoaA/NifB/PqqE/SkfB family radical SAM enzyme
MKIGIYQNIKEIHFEPTSDCNARCPQCPRNVHTSLDTNPKLKIDEWSVTDLEKTLNHKFFKDLHRFQINGNFGDIVMHSNPKSILEVIFSKKYKKVDINTNGGAQGIEFWKWLGSQGAIVNFAIDGLDDTHHLYRRNTRYDVVLKNARAYIDAGGHAVWVTTLFKHNLHQEDEMKRLSTLYGFKEFKSRHSTRFQAKKLSVVDKNYDHEYYLEPADISLQIKNIKEEDSRPPNDYKFWRDKPMPQIQRYAKAVECYAQEYQTIYLSYDKRIWPCCHIGIGFDLSKNFHWWNDTLLEIFKKDLKKDADFNNVIKHDIDQIVYKTKLFQRIENTWNTDNVCTSCVMNCSKNAPVQKELKTHSKISLK